MAIGGTLMAIGAAIAAAWGVDGPTILATIAILWLIIGIVAGAVFFADGIITRQ